MVRGVLDGHRMHIKTNLVLALSLAACGVDAPTADEGLHVSDRTADRLAGTYGGAGTSVAFELARDHGQAHVRVTDAGGRTLIDAVSDEHSDPTALIDAARLAPGDAGSPEASLLVPLRDALHAMPTTDATLAAERARGSGDMPTAQAAMTAQSCPYYFSCDSWAPPGSVVVCGTQFFGESSIYVWNDGPQWQLYSQWNASGPVVKECAVQGSFGVIPPNFDMDLSAWYWGENVYIYNTGVDWIYVSH
ncbi:MAG TPA: hypothetical protein VLX92_19010 [Kofleriaceae bacterium]|nr:hypothetical protein [Kofleriaceae bacterium]